MNRRELLTKSIYTAAGLSALGKLKAEEKATRPSGVKIIDIKPYVFKKATFVKIETDAGISGWGEGDHDHPQLTAAVVNDVCKKEVIGQDPFDGEYLWHRMYFKGEDVGSTGLLPGSIAGVDNALWDLKGKLLNLPVHKLSSGSGIQKVRVYGSFGRSGGKSGIKTPKEMAETAAQFVEQGYQTIKARMQIRQLNLDPDPDPTFKTIKAVREAIGDHIELFVDFNNGYTPAKAIYIAQKLIDHFNIAALEEPVSYHDYSGLRQVTEALDIPVMAGEHEFQKWQIRDLIVQGNVDVINADCIKAGGFSENRKIAAIAHAFDKTIMTHNTRPYLATAASLQLIASIPNATRVQEYAGKRPGLGLAHLFHNYFKFKNGYLYIPQEPGLGLHVNEEAMEKTKLNQ